MPAAIAAQQEMWATCHFADVFYFLCTEKPLAAISHAQWRMASAAEVRLMHTSHGCFKIIIACGDSWRRQTCDSSAHRFTAVVYIYQYLQTRVVSLVVNVTVIMIQGTRVVTSCMYTRTHSHVCLSVCVSVHLILTCVCISRWDSCVYSLCMYSVTTFKCVCTRARNMRSYKETYYRCVCLGMRWKCNRVWFFVSLEDVRSFPYFHRHFIYKHLFAL